MTTADGRRIAFVPIRGTWETQRYQAALQKRSAITELYPLPGEMFWFERKSMFADMLEHDYGISLLDFDGNPETPNIPLWSGALQGTVVQGWFNRAFKMRDPHWLLCGQRYARLIESRVDDYDALVSIPFSHGGQGWAAGCKMLPAYKRLRDKLLAITVDVPIRRDQESWYLAAGQRTIRWAHLHSETMRTWVRWMGARSLRRRLMPHADINIAVGSHGGALYRPYEHAPEWRLALATLGIEPLPGSPAANISLPTRPDGPDGPDGVEP